MDISGAVNEESVNFEMVSSIINNFIEECFTKYLTKDLSSLGLDARKEMTKNMEPIIDEVLHCVIPSHLSIQNNNADENKCEHLENDENFSWLRNFLLQRLTEKSFDIQIIHEEETADREMLQKELSQWLYETIDETIKAKLYNDYLEKGGWRRFLIQKDKPLHAKDNYYSYIRSTDNVLSFTEVKFVLEDGSLLTKSYQLHTTMLDIKDNFQNTLNIPHSCITLSTDGKEVHDDMSLADLKMVKPSECIELHIQIDISAYFKTITVTAETDSPGEQRIITVEIHNCCIRKPYLGGYRNKITGTEYQHAFSQTKGKIAHAEQFQRSIQTYQQKNRFQNTTSNIATQMCRPDHYIANTNDRFLSAGIYEDYASYLRRIDVDGKATIIQKVWRGYTARKKFSALKEKQRRIIEWEESQIRARKEAYEEHLKSEMVKKAYPLTKADFEKLYAMLNIWHATQYYRITKLKTEGPKRTELLFLLHKEVQGLLALEKLKREARTANLFKERKSFLALCSKPIKIINKKGQKITLETINTQRAEKLQHIYLMLSQKNVSPDEHIKIAMEIKHALTDYNKTETTDLIDLLNQKCTLLSRGIKIEDLSFLQQRLEKMFFELTKDPNFNPEAVKHIQAYVLEKRDINTSMCCSCSRLLASNFFTLTSKSKKIKKCKYCNFIKNISTTRANMEPYEYIRQQLCIDEAKQNSFASFAFIMQAEDYKMLISVIWHNESIISKCNDLNKLCLCRWNRDYDWSPWNCILLTVDEVIVHLKLTDLGQVYGCDIIGKVNEKHRIAKYHYQNLVRLEKQLHMLNGRQ